MDAKTTAKYLQPQLNRYIKVTGLAPLAVDGVIGKATATAVKMALNEIIKPCANQGDRVKIGTVGQALPGVEVKIAEDGDICFRGGNVFKGYFKNPQATAEVLEPDGWMHSGDVGVLDEQGFLKITDRKKDLIITAGGKIIAPQNIENQLKFSPYINHAVVIGDRASTSWRSSSSMKTTW